jgi:o-succinylbenzoate synthase
MKLRQVRIVPYELPFRRPFVTAHETLAVRRGFQVWLQDDRERWGVGEAAPLAGFGMESWEEAGRVLRHWAGALPGREVNLPASAAEASPALGLADDAPHAPAARHGLECALLDLAAQAAGLPLARWLHSEAAPDVVVNATLGAQSPAAAAAQARALAAEGYSAFKIKVGVGGDDQDIARVQAVRRALGAGPRLRADANGAWSEAQALAMLRRLAPLGLEYVEQPVPAADLAALARLAAQSPVPLAADEAVTSPAAAERVLAARAAQVLVLKPMALGGILPALQVARGAFAQQVAVVLTTTLEGAFARAAALHAAAALIGMAGVGLPLPACGLATGYLLAADLVAQPPQPVRGVLAVPPGAGLGLGRLHPPPDAR